jgi:hypothetical protein
MYAIQTLTAVAYIGRTKPIAQWNEDTLAVNLKESITEEARFLEMNFTSCGEKD